jgi:Reverse transcriptase (RNA-dependent DNA polymerase)
MRERMVYLINQDGNDFDTSPKMKRNLLVWSIKLNLSHLILQLDINMVMKFLAQINEYRFADCIRELGLFPCKAEPDIWMRKNGNIYEYIVVYVDDLTIAMKNPKEFTDILETKHKFKLKGTGPITFHLGMDFTRDDDNTLCISPTKYMEKLIKNYEKLFGMKPSQNVSSPLDKGDHPELDTSKLCTKEQISQYQSMIGPYSE